MADITPDKLRAPGSKQTFGGLSRTIVEQFGTNTSESSVLKDLLEQYNEIKTKYHELKVCLNEYDSNSLLVLEERHCFC